MLSSESWFSILVGLFSSHRCFCHWWCWLSIFIYPFQKKLFEKTDTKNFLTVCFIVSDDIMNWFNNNFSNGMRWGWELNEMKWNELNHKWIDKMNPIHSIWCYCVFIKAILWIHKILISNFYDGFVFS